MLNKTHLKKFAFAVIAAVTLISVTPLSASANTSTSGVSNYKNNNLSLKVKSSIAIDSQTGQILYAKNANKIMPIASMTKMITVYLTLEAIKDGKIKWNTQVEPTKNIVKVANNAEFSNVPLRLHHKYTVKQLYQATLIESANGAAMCLAKAVSGNQKNFVDLMRKQVKEWGINGAKLYTACGLPNGSVGFDKYPGAGKKAENQMSARDMAVVSQKLLMDYPEVIKTTKLAHLAFKDQGKSTRMTNFNWMLKGLSQYNRALPVDGLKTGTTDAAGACFASTLSYKGGRLITVVMGARHQDGTDPSRFIETAKLLNWSLKNYQPIILKKHEILQDARSVQVKNGDKYSTNVGIEQKTVIWDPVDGMPLKAKLTESTVNAPLIKNKEVTTYQFSSGNEKLISIDEPDSMTEGAVALENNNEINVFAKIWRWITGRS